MYEEEYQHLIDKARDAKLGGHDSWRPMSAGEKVAIALLLNRPEWLTEMDYTIPQAIERAGPVWMRLIPIIAQTLADEDES